MFKKLIHYYAESLFRQYNSLIDSYEHREKKKWDNNFIVKFIPFTFISKEYILTNAISTLVVAHLKTLNPYYNHGIGMCLSNLILTDEKLIKKEIIHNVYKFFKKDKNIKVKKIINKKANYAIHIFITYYEVPFLIFINPDDIFSIGLWSNRKTDSKIERKLRKKLNNIGINIYKKYLFKNDKFDLIYNKLKAFSRSYSKLGIGRYVILLYGPPGTGKTFLAKMLQQVLMVENDIFYNIFSVSDIKNELSKYLKANNDKRDSSDNPSLNYNDGYALEFEIVDEFDSYISSINDQSITARHNAGIIKKALDNAKGIVILISNHVDDIDPAILRDDRINLKVKIDENFYSVNDKKELVNKILNRYNVNIDEIKDRINNINYNKTVAHIINEVKNILLDYSANV